jgi:hypothetical protein
MMTSRNLNINIKKLGLRIGKDVKNDGNCWYHSMVYLGYGESASKFRSGLAEMMFTLGSHKGIFPNQPDVSLRDIFTVTDEVGKVFDCETSKTIDYNYDAMCRDMRTPGSWNRLPMNLIMQFTSLIYNIEFRIVTNTLNQKPLKVVWNESGTYTNYVDLAKLGEVHYLPLEYDDSDTDTDTDNEVYDVSDCSIDTNIFDLSDDNDNANIGDNDHTIISEDVVVNDD